MDFQRSTLFVSGFESSGPASMSFPENLNANKCESEQRTYNVFWSKSGFAKQQPSKNWKTDIGQSKAKQS